MKTRIALTIASLLSYTAAQAGSVAFRGVNIIPMTQADWVQHDQCVLVSDNRIIQISANDDCDPPADAVQIDGGWIIPGLAEMHAHIPTPEQGAHEVGDVLTLMLANGITTARGMLGDPYHLELREQLGSGEVLGPRLYTSGPSLNGRSAGDPDTAEKMVRAQHAAGYDFIKIHPGLSVETFDVLAKIANELDIPFAGHVSLEVGVRRALAAGQASIDHLDGYAQRMVDPESAENIPNPAFFGFNLGPWFEPATIPVLANEAANNQTWMVPTQSLIENVIGPLTSSELSQRPEMRYASDGQFNEWAAAKSSMMENPLYRADLAQRFIYMRRGLIKAMYDAGAPMLLGSDAPQIYNVPGFSLHRELQILVDAGLTPWQALQTGTRNVAVFFEAEGEFGTIQEGLSADFLLLKSNPLEDISAAADPAGVMLRGRWLPEAELQRMLDEIEQRLRS